MDKLKRARAPMRGLITKIINEIVTELAAEEKDFINLKAKYERLNDLQSRIQDVDQSIFTEMLADTVISEEDQLNEAIACDDIVTRIITAKLKIDEEIVKNELKVVNDDRLSSVSSTSVRKRQFRLPKIELKKFNGKILEWLGWWAQFSKIHEDEELHATDKFQYLIQSMESNTKGADIVKGFPATEANYPKAIQALQDRFGRKKMLIQVYIRELFKMSLDSMNTKANISTMYDKLVCHIRALNSLNVTVEQASLFLYPMVEASLPEDVLVAWQRSAKYEQDGSIENPPKSELDYLLEFLQQEVEREEQRALVKTGLSNSKVSQKKSEGSSIPTAAALHISDVKVECIFCDRRHLSHDCRTAVKMTNEQKWERVKRKNVCGRCLLPGHRPLKCKTLLSCSSCSGSHYKIMCREPTNSNEKSQEVAVANSSSNNVLNSQIILKTIMLKIKTVNGIITVRGFLDDGSQRSYISTKLAKKVNGPLVVKYFERNTLFGGVMSGIEERSVYEVQLCGRNKEIFKLELANKDVITGTIEKLPQGPWMDELKKLNIQISDCESCIEDIDILLGADVLPKLMMDKSILLKCGLMAIDTVFGWTIMGPIPRKMNLNSAMQMSISLMNDSNVTQLWELETIGIRDPFEVKAKDERDRQVKEEFVEKMSYTDNGKYEVSLPWIDGAQAIPDNFDIAVKRLVNSTKTLKQKGMYDTYDGLFKQWEKEDFIKEVKEVNVKQCHYIPHHPVYKPNSKTTPVRPVFDASCKTGRHPSLNECLEKGPNLMELIPNVMLQFRDGLIGIVSDIRKAFQKILVKKEDQMFLLFLWWEDESCTKPKIFKHKRVVFGLKCSPFILAAVIGHHLENVSSEDKLTAEKLKKSLYVDNSITSVDTMQQYEDFKGNAMKILAKANMELRQWEHTEEQADIEQISLHEDFFTSVLGMRWNRKKDTLSCASSPEIPDKLTKRSLLATINKVFDPMGILVPAMIYPKMMLQSTWQKKVGWDDEIPLETTDDFKKWAKELNYLQKVEIPRNMRGNYYLQENSSEQLHVFCDASQLAYAAVAFLRVESSKEVSVQMIQAKARVAPLQKMTIPRIELMACTIGARLGTSITRAFEREIRCYYWSDSTTALAWIGRNDEWGTFVGNRVREIVKLGTANEWKHVPGNLNPADFPSRGGSPKELLQSIWWEGPEWLKRPSNEWPNEEFHIDEEAVNSERKKAVVTSNNLKIIAIVESPWYSKSNSHLLNLRKIAFLKRFAYNCMAKKRNVERRVGYLTLEEFDEAEIAIVKMIQKQVFPSISNFIAGLKVAKDRDGIYHVVTKLLYRHDSGRFKRPLLLPCVHPDVEKLIVEEHLRYGHAGKHFLVNKLRDKFWIIHSKKAVKRVIKKCTTCIRFSRLPVTVPAAPLPENRVKNAKVFEITGIDLAGPLYLKTNEKQWIVIFTCAVIRAVHLELVEKINTEEFILALGRFIYRRGRPSIIYTDCGTNFVSTANLFGKINWKNVSEDSRVQRITWIFNPPASPWWGGFWERLIRVVKEYLRKLLGHNKLTKTELDTSVCFVESLMNGRPLTYVSDDPDDPDDLVPLTPALFLRDIEEAEFPEIEAMTGSKLREKLRHLIQLKGELRSRFRSEYLGLLAQRVNPTDNYQFQLGEIVLIASDDKKRLEWPMARIIELIKGTDGEIRVAKVKTKKGELTRSLQRLIPMEVGNDGQFTMDNEMKIRAKEIKEIETAEPVVKNRSRVKKDTAGAGKCMSEEVSSTEKVERVTRYGRRIKTPIRFS